MSITFGADIIHANIDHAPAGQLAGYTTGTPDIVWPAGSWAAHPGSVRIDQDAAASDHTADVLDVERGAATIAEVPAWFAATLASYQTGKRPGQRYPAVYLSQSNVTPLANALVSAGHQFTPRLWVANWSAGLPAAEGAINTAAGPWPVIGFQYQSLQFYDLDVFSTQWLQAVSHAPAAPLAPWAVPVIADLASALALVNKSVSAIRADAH